jgi:hypothetical protein
MSELHEIESLCRAYSQERDVLSGRVGELTKEVEDAQRRKLPGIKKAVGLVAEAFARLKAAVEAAPHLFQKPKTFIFHGVKVGFAKGRGKLTWEDDDQVIRLIRKKLPEDLHDVLIKVKETVAAEALENLTTEQLKSIGVQVEGSGERVVVKPVDGEVEKVVKSLLKNAESVAEEAHREAA